MKFNKGSELDKQIYKEGEPTWGCKSGVLDVEDVKEFIRLLNELIKSKFFNTKNSIMGVGWYEASARDLLFQINELAGNKLIEDAKCTADEGGKK